jgi:hypothetical protein
LILNGIWNQVTFFWKNNRDWNLTINLKQKSNKRSMAETIPWETKRAQERPKAAQPKGSKKRERASLYHDRKLSHPQAF